MDLRTTVGTKPRFPTGSSYENGVRASNLLVEGSWVPVGWAEGWVPTVFVRPGERPQPNG